MSGDGLSPGSSIGAYRVVEAIGKGGMGAVFRAEDAAGRSVAIKVIGADVARDERFMARFRREARALRAVSHPNVAAVLEVGEEKGRPFLVLEYVPGGSLQGELARGPLPWREAARLGAQIARALSAVHAAGLVHRDLKPANVLLDSRRDAKLCDFGVVRRSGDSLAQSAGLTRAGEIVGTLQYMAPEQADGGEGRIDARTDLYSLGATLFALVAGRPPFEGTGVALLRAHLTARPPAPSSLAPEVPAELDALVLRLLAKSPGDRPASALEVAAELEALAGTSRGRTGRVALAVGGAAALAVLLLALLLLFLPGRGPGQGPVAPTGETPPPPPPPPPSRPVEAKPRASPPPEAIAPRRRWTGTHNAKVMGSAFSPDGRYLLTGAGDSTIKLWRAESLGTNVPPAATLPGPDMTWCVAWLPDGKRAITAGYDGKVRLWDLAKMLAGGGAASQIGKEGVHGGKLDALAVSRDGKRAITGSSERTLALWEIGTGELVLSKKIPAHGAGCAAFLPDGGRVVTGGSDDKLVVTDLATGESSPPIEPRRSWIVSLALSRDARTVVTAGWWPGTADVWSLEDRTRRASLEKHTKSIRSLALSPDGTLLVTGSLDRTLVVWRTDEWKPAATIDAEGSVGTVAFSPDGRSVAAGHEEGDPSLVTLWDLAGE